MLLALIVVTLALSAFFSGSEIAFVTANRLRAEVEAERAGWAGRVARGFLHKPEALLTTTLVGNNIALVGYSTLMGVALQAPLQAALTRVLGPESAALGFGVLVLQTLIATAVVFFFGEVLPKTLLREPSGKMLVRIAPPLRVAQFVFSIPIAVAGWASTSLLRLFRAPTQSFKGFVRTDFEVALRESGEAGTLELDEGERAILENVLDLRDKRVKDTMVPRTDIEAVGVEATLDDVRERFVETGYSRLPVVREDIDHIVGAVFAADLFREPTSLRAITRDLLAVPEQKPARSLLNDFLQSGTSIAVVIDEYGGTAGLVTIEDLLEELFGDIRDEHDDEDALVRPIDARTVVADARAEMVHVAAALNLDAPDENPTVAGFILDEIGRIPRAQEQLLIGKFRVTVLQATPNRIVRARIARDDG